jgi:hypothetical protein
MPHTVKHVLAVGAIVVSASLLASTGLAAKRHPSVAIVDQSPIVVVGRGFAARERVTVRASHGGQQLTRTLRATRTGAFRTELGELDQSSCAPVLSVTVVGGAGSRATAARHVTIAEPCGIVIQP